MRKIRVAPSLKLNNIDGLSCMVVLPFFGIQHLHCRQFVHRRNWT